LQLLWTRVHEKVSSKLQEVYNSWSVAAKGYHLYDSTTRLVIEKRDVLFDENDDAVDDDKTVFDLFPEAGRIGHDSSQTGGDDRSSKSSD